MHPSTVHDKPSQVVLSEHLCNVAAMSPHCNTLKLTAKETIAAGGCGCLGSQCGWVNTSGSEFGKITHSQSLSFWLGILKLTSNMDGVKENWCDSLCSELSETRMMSCVLMNAKLSMKKTAVWNDLRNHIKQKEIHLRAERWEPVRDFSYTRQDGQKSRYWKYYTHCLSAFLQT